MNSIIITKDAASIFINFTPYVVSNDHPKYQEIITAARDGNWESIPNLLDLVEVVKESIKETNNPNIKIVGEQIEYKHVIFPPDLSQYVLNMIRDQFDLNPIIRFMDNLMANPDHRVFQQLFGFMSYGKNPITPDGNFLAYKKVQANYMSVHGGATNHAIGNVVTMPRDQCNSDPEQTCSSGLHFCSRDYLNNFGGDKVIILEINPSDVVSIPVDYNNTKGRACKYKVVAELTEKEIVRVATTDVLKTSSVEDQYTTKNNDTPVEIIAPSPTVAPAITETSSDIDQYIQGHIDGRKKAEKSLTSEMYLQGFKDGKNKKGRRYGHYK